MVSTSHHYMSGETEAQRGTGLCQEVQRKVNTDNRSLDSFFLFLSFIFLFHNVSCHTVSKSIAGKFTHLSSLPTPQMLLGTRPCAEAVRSRTA